MKWVNKLIMQHLGRWALFEMVNIRISVCELNNYNFDILHIFITKYICDVIKWMSGEPIPGFKLLKQILCRYTSHLEYWSCNSQLYIENVSLDVVERPNGTT